MRGSEDVGNGPAGGGGGGGDPQDDYELLMKQLRIFAKRRITEAGLSQGAFARRAGVSPATISDWLKGSELQPESLRKVCGALHHLRPHAATASVLREAEALAATG